MGKKRIIRVREPDNLINEKSLLNPSTYKNKAKGKKNIPFSDHQEFEF